MESEREVKREESFHGRMAATYHPPATHTCVATCQVPALVQAHTRQVLTQASSEKKRKGGGGGAFLRLGLLSAV